MNGGENEHSGGQDWTPGFDTDMRAYDEGTAVKAVITVLVLDVFAGLTLWQMIVHGPALFAGLCS